MSRRYISIAEAAEYLKISDRTVRRLIADGELTGYFIGRGHLMLRVDLRDRRKANATHRLSLERSIR
jgi:excisionase family DNA binding protein